MDAWFVDRPNANYAYSCIYRRLYNITYKIWQISNVKKGKLLASQREIQSIDFFAFQFLRNEVWKSRHLSKASIMNLLQKLLSKRSIISFDLTMYAWREMLILVQGWERTQNHSRSIFSKGKLQHLFYQGKSDHV